MMGKNFRFKKRSHHIRPSREPKQPRPMTPEEEIKEVQDRIRDLEYNRLTIEKNKHPMLRMRKAYAIINLTEQIQMEYEKLKNLEKTLGHRNE